jgi:hypothetical protein
MPDHVLLACFDCITTTSYHARLVGSTSELVRLRHIYDTIALLSGLPRSQSLPKDTTLRHLVSHLYFFVFYLAHRHKIWMDFSGPGVMALGHGMECGRTILTYSVPGVLRIPYPPPYHFLKFGSSASRRGYKGVASLFQVLLSLSLSAHIIRYTTLLFYERGTCPSMRCANCDTDYPGISISLAYYNFLLALCVLDGHFSKSGVGMDRFETSTSRTRPALPKRQFVPTSNHLCTPNNFHNFIHLTQHDHQR